jgi:hypothetical protein
MVMKLFEHGDTELLANGASVTELLDCLVPSERAVADLLARRMLELEGGDWSYTHFYGPTRGALEPTGDEIRAFLERCSTAGVRLRYRDGTEVEIQA